ncbi:Cobalt-precorrin-5B (C1)-methyltransferase [hydrothermal vent metagenome]|uniref:Cobalt-precorrin-5B (C1)-methyltransferase n=1 Tax=hydrothermal vent metagenome TaxID=652676 RepID=A0A3B1DFE4_9ZZZZ
MVEAKLKVPERNKKGSRTGFTTGACAAAAAKAAVRCLMVNQVLEEIESVLPNKQKVVFKLEQCKQLSDTAAMASIIKDAGDDPDCTHGAEIIARVKLTENEGVEIFNGKGVGTITKPGLGIEVGQPSITINPLKNIMEMVKLELSQNFKYKGAQVTISVPNGEELAKQTTNARLGIEGGISILGTTGIVRPYSTAAFKFSVIKEIEVAHAQGILEVVLTTGGKSEQFAMNFFPKFKEESFIQVGDFIGVGLKASVRCRMLKIHIVGMMGKLSKMADGQMQTHVAGSKVNMNLLAGLAKEAGASENLCQEIQQANTARHALELAEKENILNITNLVCREVCHITEKYIEQALSVHTYLFDFNGKLLAKGGV